MKAPVKKSRAKAKAVTACLLLGMLAFLPFKACGCASTWQVSPMRMVLAGQLAWVLWVVVLAVPRFRGAWGLGAFMVAAVSCAAAKALAPTQPFLALATLLVTPVATLCAVAWQRVRHGRMSNGSAGSGEAEPQPEG